MAAERKSGRATIRDVAATAGVSKSLVSFVYSNPERVSEESRVRVLNAAERLGYRPNWAARSLNAEHGGFTGILMADLHSPPFAQLVDYARAELQAKGRTALMTSANPIGGVEAGTAAMQDLNARPGMDSETLGFFGDLRPRSLIVVGSAIDMSSIEPLVKDIPSVIAGGIETSLPFAATIRTDHRRGMRLLIDHLRERGHVRIAHVGGLGGPVGEVRAEEYARAMRETGLSTHVQIEKADFTEISGYHAACRLLESDDPPTAITAINDLSAVGVLGALGGHSDIAVTGYGDTAVADFRLTQLTTVRAHNGEIGRKAVEELLRAEATLNSHPREVLVNPSLVVRRTA